MGLEPSRQLTSAATETRFDNGGATVTQQGIPAFEWSEDALRVRQYLYEFWCEHGHGPSLRDVHEALELSRDDIIAAYK